MIPVNLCRVCATSVLCHSAPSIYAIMLDSSRLGVASGLTAHTLPLPRSLTVSPRILDRVPGCRQTMQKAKLENGRRSAHKNATEHTARTRTDACAQARRTVSHSHSMPCHRRFGAWALPNAHIHVHVHVAMLPCCCKSLMRQVITQSKFPRQ